MEDLLEKVSLAGVDKAVFTFHALEAVRSWSRRLPNMTDAFARMLIGVLDLFGSRAVTGGLTIPVVDCLAPIASSARRK